RMSDNVLKRKEIGMWNLGVLGNRVIGEVFDAEVIDGAGGGFGGGGFRGGKGGGGVGQVANPLTGATRFPVSGDALESVGAVIMEAKERPELTGSPLIEPTIRKNFADTAYWNASLTTGKDGIAEVSLTMPENLTAWKVKVWAMGHGTKVGQGEAVVT